MRTSLVRGFLITIMILAFSTWGIAQYSYPTVEEKPLTWNLNAGMFFPANQGDLTSTFNVGIEYEDRMSSVGDGLPGNLAVSVDYASFRTTFGTGSKSVALIPILLNWKNHYPKSGSPRSSWFWGLGIGTFWATDEIPDMGLNNGFQFAYDAALGYNFSPKWFLQSRYMGSTNGSGSGIFALDLGYSF